MCLVQRKGSLQEQPPEDKAAPLPSPALEGVNHQPLFLWSHIPVKRAKVSAPSVCGHRAQTSWDHPFAHDHSTPQSNVRPNPSSPGSQSVLTTPHPLSYESECVPHGARLGALGSRDR